MKGRRMTPTLDAIARPSGAFAMVAMDQRESLRAMFAEAGAGRADDATMTAFKLAVASTLGDRASGFLIDRTFGFDGVRAGALPPGCGLILAADALDQSPGGPVEDTSIDETVAAPGFDLTGVSALKLLLIWRRDPYREQRIALARRFIALAAARGVLSVLEPIARDGDEAILEAARELAPLRPSLYKAQLPGQGRGPGLRANCERLTETIDGPWVVLSQGVDRDDFLPAVETACRAGASGFLAGRALWSDVVGRPGDELVTIARPRLERLIEVVDAHARPWRQA
jgi:sulfofructosephosphate aldolase